MKSLILIIIAVFAVSLIGTAFLVWEGQQSYCIKEKGGLTIIP